MWSRWLLSAWSKPLRPLQLAGAAHFLQRNRPPISDVSRLSRVRIEVLPKADREVRPEDHREARRGHHALLRVVRNPIL